MVNILHYYCRPNHKDLLNDITYNLGISCNVNETFLDISDITKELQNKKHIDCIAIDEELFGKFDTPDDIVTKIEVLRFLCENTEILIIALNKAYDDEVIEALRTARMADYIITSNMAENFREYITMYLNGDNNKESPAVSIGNEKSHHDNISEEHNKLDSTVHYDTERKPVEEKQHIEPVNQDSVNSKPPAQHPASESEPIVLNPNRMITIGVCGLQPHIGATHHSLAMAIALSKSYKNVCYKENNDHNAYRVLQDSSLASMKQGYINIMGIDIYDVHTDMSLTDKDYQFCVMDFGYIRECKGDDFFKCDIPIIIAGAKDWEFNYFVGAYSSGTLDDAILIINFFPYAEQENFAAAFPNLQIYFSDYAPEVFAIGDNTALYNRIVTNNLNDWRLRNEKD